MKHAKAKMIVVSLIPFILLAAAGILEAVVSIGYRKDPYHWFEHPLTMVTALLVAAAMLASVVCFICVRIMRRRACEDSAFANIVSIVGLALPVTILFADMIRSCLS